MWDILSEACALSYEFRDRSAVDRETIRPVVAADELTIIRPFSAQNINQDHAPAFDIVVLLDPFSNRNRPQDCVDQVKDHWLQYHLAETFENARIFAFGDDEPHLFKKSPKADIEHFSLTFLKKFVQLRQSQDIVGQINLSPSIVPVSIVLLCFPLSL